MNRPRLDRARAIVLLGALALGSGSARAQATFDLQADWSNAQNPNGVWSYKFNDTPIATNWPNWSGWGVPAWAAGATGAATIPAWLKIQAPPPSALLDMPLGSVVTHCSDLSIPVDVTWTCPTAGDYAVHMEVWFGGGDDPVHQGRAAFWSAFSKAVHLTTGHVGWGDPYDSSNPAEFDFADTFAVGDVVKISVVRDFAGFWGSFYGMRLTIGPTATTYCTAKVNSLGCVPAVSATGLPIAAPANDFHVHCTNVVNQMNAIFFWGTAPQAAPFQGGILCVAPPLERTPVQNAGGSGGAPDCSGSYDFHFSEAYIAAQTLAGVGDEVFGQFWSRDPAHPDGTGVGLSDAIRFRILP